MPKKFIIPGSYDYYKRYLVRLKPTSIPFDKLFEVKYARSSAPGGQKVNKTETKLIITMSQYSMDKELKKYIPELIHEKYLARSSRYKRARQGGVVISSDSSRSREQNVKDCQRKFLEDLKKVRLDIPRDINVDKVVKWENLDKKEAQLRKIDKMMRKAKKLKRKMVTDDF